MSRLTKLRRRSLIHIAVLAAFSGAPFSEAWAKSLALVIGNQNYSHIGALSYAHNDAEGYKEALENKGFDVTLGLDLDRNAMEAHIEAFTRKVEPGDVVVVVFSGHGWSDGGAAYLTPVDIPSNVGITRVRRASYPLFDEDDGLMALLRGRGASLRVLIIDACRTELFESALPISDAVTKGVSLSQAQDGEFIIYSAGANQRAIDRLKDDKNQRHSLFTRVFLPHFQEDISLMAAFLRSQDDVAALARAGSHVQRPDVSANGVVDACLSETCKDIQGAAPRTPPVAPPPDPAQKAACEAASQPTDSDKPFGIIGIYYEDLKPEHYVEACEAIVRAATSTTERRLHLNNLANLRLKQNRASEAMSLAVEAADLGSSSAMNLVAFMLRTGPSGVPKNPAAAEEWYRKAAEGGNVVAMYNLSLRYAKGSDTLPQDDEKARYWRDLALKDNDPWILNLIACAYFQGSDGLPKDAAQAVLWWEKAAAAGSVDAKASLGWIYIHGGEGVEADPERGVEISLAAAKEGAPVGNNLGFAYSAGLGARQDDAEAVLWWRQGAEARQVDSMVNLGWAYWNGRGVEQDDAEAVRLWREALELKKDGGTMQRLGEAYWYGRGVERQDYAEAVRLWREAAAQKNARAMSWLGEAYWRGRGVAKSDEEAVDWWRKAADLGNAAAMSSLGWAYWQGRGVERQDASEAVRLWNEALKLDEEATSAMVNLGQAYWIGDRVGVKQDPAEALRLWRRAADLGNLNAMVELGEAYRRESDANPKDEAQTLYWWTKAADLGSARAMHNLWIYSRMFTPPLDLEKAKAWLLKAVELGDLDAANDLGRAHYYGSDGFPPNQPEGMRMLLEAAEAGNRAAMWSLIQVYAPKEGDPRPPNLQEAMRWREALFEANGFLGDNELMTLTIFYLEPVNGVSRNREHAFYLFEKSAEAGSLASMVALGNFFSGLEEIRREAPPELASAFPPPDPEKALFWLRKALAHLELPEAAKAKLQEVISRLEAQAQ